jgi:hypothetical protein
MQKKGGYGKSKPSNKIVNLGHFFHKNPLYKSQFHFFCLLPSGKKILPTKKKKTVASSRKTKK